MKTAEQYKQDMETQRREDDAELTKLAPDFPVPAGFTTEWRDNYQGWGRRVFVMLKPDDVEFVFMPGGSGTTNFKIKDGWRTFDRRGVDDSFQWKDYDFTKDATGRILANVAEVLGEQLARIAKSREFYASAIPVPQIGHTVSPDASVTYKKQLKSGKSVTFTPSGFGTGYTVTPRKPNHRFGVTRATAELEKFFECSPLWVETFDCD